MKQMKLFSRRLILVLFAVMTLSCSGKRVLIIEDPYFDHFASSDVRFYHIRKRVLFLTSGLRIETVNPVENPSSIKEAEEALNSGRYKGFINFYQYHQAIQVPPNVRTVLIGGSRELDYPEITQIISSGTEALSLVGQELLNLWNNEGIVPLTVFWEKQSAGEQEKKALLGPWGDNPVLNDNILVLNENTADVQLKIESFFSRYDFQTENYIILAYSPEVYKEFFRSLPEGEDIPAIYVLPDNPVLPESAYGIITEDYTGQLKAALSAVKSGSKGKKIKVENKFIRK
ncbi:MAG: hypothetical protein PQJ58_15005 [Spirochaetales bacterium]|nr:hypothetical protein [Spirochaetales bacterium]